MILCVKHLPLRPHSRRDIPSYPSLPPRLTPPHPQVARLAQHELGRVLAFSKHIRTCANKYEVGVNFRVNSPNYDRVVEMSALVAALNLAFPEYQDPSNYPWPGIERKLQPGSGWSPSPRPPVISHRDPGDDIKEFLAKADAGIAADKSRASPGPEMSRAMAPAGLGGQGRSAVKQGRQAWGEGTDPDGVDRRHLVKGDGEQVGGRPGQHVSVGVRPSSASAVRPLQQTASGRFNAMTSPEPGSVAFSSQAGQAGLSPYAVGGGRHGQAQRPQSAGAGTHHGAAGASRSAFLDTYDGGGVPSSRGIAGHHTPRALTPGISARPHSGRAGGAYASPMSRRPHSASVGPAPVQAMSASYRNLPARGLEVQPAYILSAASMQAMMAARSGVGHSLSDLFRGRGGAESPSQGSPSGGSAGGSSSRSHSRQGQNSSFVRDLARQACPEVAGLDPMPSDL